MARVKEKRLAEVYLRIASERFHFLKFILEGYDNLAVLSSVSSRRGVVRLRFSSQSAKDVYQLLAEISNKIRK